MSDFLDIPENPTLAVHFPWNARPTLVCLNCNQYVSNVHARKHALVDRWTDGCGIEFQFIAGACRQPEWVQHVKDLRPDLIWKDVEFG